MTLTLSFNGANGEMIRVRRDRVWKVQKHATFVTLATAVQFNRVVQVTPDATTTLEEFFRQTVMGAVNGECEKWLIWDNFAVRVDEVEAVVRAPHGLTIELCSSIGGLNVVCADAERDRIRDSLVHRLGWQVSAAPQASNLTRLDFEIFRLMGDLVSLLTPRVDLLDEAGRFRFIVERNTIVLQRERDVLMEAESGVVFTSTGSIAKRWQERFIEMATRELKRRRNAVPQIPVPRSIVEGRWSPVAQDMVNKVFAKTFGA